MALYSAWPHPRKSFIIVNCSHRTLREEGIKKRAEGDRMVDFSPGSLTKMIDNQIYIGYKEYNKNFKVMENGEEVRKQILTNIKRQDYNPNLQIPYESL